MNMSVAIPTKQELQRLLTMELRQGFNSKDLLLFYTQMSILIESGTSLPLGLEALEKQADKVRMKQIIGDLKRLVHEGLSLSQAMTKYPKLFSAVDVGMIRAGESGGFLPRVFQRLVMMQEQQQELRSIVRSTFAYPSVLFVVAVLVIIFMMTFILPKFIAIYESAGVVLPLLTRILLGIYGVVTGYWIVCLPVVGLMVWVGIQKILTPRGRAVIDRLKVDLPMIRGLFRGVYLERTLRTLGILLDSGVPIYDALTLTRSTIGNQHFETLLATVLDNVSQGQGLAVSLSQSDLVPPMVRQMVQTGEHAGNTGAILSRLADYYAGRIREQVRILTRLLEPAMTLVMGCVIGFVALALILPILQLARTLHPS